MEHPPGEPVADPTAEMSPIIDDPSPTPAPQAKPMRRLERRYVVARVALIVVLLMSIMAHLAWDNVFTLIIMSLLLAAAAIMLGAIAWSARFDAHRKLVTTYRNVRHPYSKKYELSVKHKSDDTAVWTCTTVVHQRGSKTVTKTMQPIAIKRSPIINPRYADSIKEWVPTKGEDEITMLHRQHKIVIIIKAWPATLGVLAWALAAIVAAWWFSATLPALISIFFAGIIVVGVVKGAIYWAWEYRPLYHLATNKRVGWRLEPIVPNPGDTQMFNWSQVASANYKPYKWTGIVWFIHTGYVVVKPMASSGKTSEIILHFVVDGPEFEKIAAEWVESKRVPQAVPAAPTAQTTK